MSLYFQGWDVYFSGWEGSAPTPMPTIGGGGGGGGSPSYLRRRMPQDVDEWFRAYQDLRKVAGKEAAKIVKPFAETKARVPTAEVVDWDVFARDAEATHKLFALWISEMDILDDDDDIVMLEH